MVQVDEASNAASTLQRTAELLPAMLGGDEKRTWLMLFQNPAELRSLGGMPGATAVLTAENGRVELAEQGTAAISRYPSPVMELDPELTALYGNRPAVWFSGTTVLPDFALAAPIAREMWEREHGTSADGVVSIDPIALSYMLEPTGPIQLPTGETLTADNAVDLLLNEVYLRDLGPGRAERRVRPGRGDRVRDADQRERGPVEGARRAQPRRRRAPAAAVECARRRAASARRDDSLGSSARHRRRRRAFRRLSQRRHRVETGRPPRRRPGTHLEPVRR